LELGGAVPEENGALPAQAMAHFAELGPLLQRANEIAERHRGARSVLARSLAEREGLALLPRLESARRETQAQIGALEGRFPELERRGPCEAGSEAMEILHSLLFLEKWEGQLQEAWGRLGCW
jgi:hypothetical protein